jgi:uncharacterized repeat protein (TIGR03803 family)
MGLSPVLWLQGADGVYEVLAQLERPGVQPQAALNPQVDGSCFTVASAGGAADAGAILRLSAAGALETALSFSGTGGAAPGRAPLSAPVTGYDGALWGTTLSGGAGDFGTVYRFESGVGFQSKVAFTGPGGAAPGAGPNELSLFSDGNYYGTTQAGGVGGFGTIFRISPAGVVTDLGDFTGNAGAQPGSQPVGALVTAGGFRYGVTQTGGASNLGTVFRLTPAGGFLPLAAFTASTGSKPRAGLLAHPDGNLYGTCSAGGAQGFGTIFRVTPAGGLSVLHSFLDTDGSAPAAALTPGPGNVLMGIASQGGAGGWGVIFKCTTSGTFSVLTELTGNAGARPGAYPLAALSLGLDGNFYGATSAGGPGQDGGFFRLTAAGVYTRLAECTGTLGWAPAGAPLAENAGSWLTPMAAGGSGGGGTLLRQTGSALPTLAAVLGGTAGDQPAGALTRTAAGLFGVTAAGGASDRGTFFRLNAGVISPLNQHTNPQGAAAEGPLTQGADGNFYGVAREGGSTANGTIFKITPAGVRTRLVNLTGTSGAARGTRPRAPLALGPDGNFYGACTNGGAADQGLIFRLTPAGVYTVVMEFPAAGVRQPAGGLTVKDGLFYGTTSAGGPADAGTLFSLTTGGVLTTLASFTGSSGNLPGNGPGVLALAADGSFYGLTTRGGASGEGTAYQLLPDGSARCLVEFTGTSGASPGRAASPAKLAQAATGGLTPSSDGWAYGALPGGGSGGGGVLFRVRPPSGFELWQKDTLSNLPPELTTDPADPDQDGLSNLMEYALNTSPLLPDPPLAPEWISVSDRPHLALHFSRNPLRSDLEIAFEATPDLDQPWQTVALSTQGQPFAGSCPITGDGTGPAVRDVTLTDSGDPSTSAKRFIRLRITRHVP